ncbi:MAG: BACON domain-containing protein [Muribaculaceae bacterium]|nr:BACON domain-containing protein [Muribaculaceae bacterium]
MKRLSVLLITLWLAVTSAFADNTTLNKAQELLMNARTIEQYDKALKKFKTADSDPGYVPAQQDEAIARGIKECEAKIAQLSSSAKIKINGSASPSVDFEAAGGALTMGVSAGKSARIKAKSGAAWLSVETVGKDSIALRCEPNEGKEPRTATVTVSAGGASAKVKVSQAFVEYVISDIKYGCTDSQGNETQRLGQPLISETLLYLVPQLKISGMLSPVDKEFSMKIYGPDQQVITSEEKTVSLWPGDNIVKFSGWGNDLPGAWPEGTYRLEVWVDGKKEVNKPFSIASRGFTIWDVEFAATDKKGNLKSAYGEPLYTEDANCVRPRIVYCGVPADQGSETRTLSVKVFRNGALDRNKKSPDNYSFAETVCLVPGTNVYELPAWGTGKRGAYPEGEYRFEIWCDGKILYHTKFYVTSKRDK